MRMLVEVEVVSPFGLGKEMCCWGWKQHGVLLQAEAEEQAQHGVGEPKAAAPRTLASGMNWAASRGHGVAILSA